MEGERLGDSDGDGMKRALLSNTSCAIGVGTSRSMPSASNSPIMHTRSCVIARKQGRSLGLMLMHLQKPKRNADVQLSLPFFLVARGCSTDQRRPTNKQREETTTHCLIRSRSFFGQLSSSGSPWNLSFCTITRIMQ